jgi:hypothetical protein
LISVVGINNDPLRGRDPSYIAQIVQDCGHFLVRKLDLRHSAIPRAHPFSQTLRQLFYRVSQINISKWRRVGEWALSRGFDGMTAGTMLLLVTRGFGVSPLFRRSLFFWPKRWQMSIRKVILPEVSELTDMICENGMTHGKVAFRPFPPRNAVQRVEPCSFLWSVRWSASRCSYRRHAAR